MMYVEHDGVSFSDSSVPNSATQLVESEQDDVGSSSDDEPVPAQVDAERNEIEDDGEAEQNEAEDDVGSSSDDEAESTAELMDLPCDQCEYRATSYSQLNGHRVARHSVARACEVKGCNRVLGTPGAYVLHMKAHMRKGEAKNVEPKRKRKVQDVRTCEICGREIATAGAFAGHMTAHAKRGETSLPITNGASTSVAIRPVSRGRAKKIPPMKTLTPAQVLRANRVNDFETQLQTTDDLIEHSRELMRSLAVVMSELSTRTAESEAKLARVREAIAE